jgi:hypothetical protein
VFGRRPDDDFRAKREVITTLRDRPMLKSMTVVVATGLAVFGVSSLAGAAKTGTTPSPSGKTLVAVLGPKVNVAPGKFARAYALCPNGYYVTGGGAYSGAITEIISSPMPNLSGWFVDGTNTDKQKRTFQHRADAVCMKGTPTVPSGTVASEAALSRQAEADFVASHGAHRGP